MRYLKFVIERYRGIIAPLTIDLTSRSLIPIVGINECGKTTILEAILAFDSYADTQNEGHHLADLANLSALRNEEPRVTATIEVSVAEANELAETITVSLTEEDRAAVQALAGREEAGNQDGADTDLLLSINLSASTASALVMKQQLERFRRNLAKATEPLTVTLTRWLSQKAYRIEGLDDSDSARLLATEVLKHTPYIFYFDDFRHEVPDVVPLEKNKPTEWANILATLFRRAGEELDVFDLAPDDRLRKSAVALAESTLNEALTRQWQEFNLEKSHRLSIGLNYLLPDTKRAVPAVSFDVVEKNEQGKEHFFHIKDRSKGFFWFFNFVMRLEFNAKSNNAELGALYLLDEPGSYLHASAQTRLCKKLMGLSRQTPVIYCTHSHHLLEPSVIPISNILIVEKTAQAGIRVVPIFEHDGGNARNLAFQPIYEALQVAPTTFEFAGKRVLVTEGLYDFFAYDMFKSDDILVVPAVGAEAIRFVLSWLVACGADYRALWDNDEAGRAGLKKAQDHFGGEEARRRFRLLPKAGRTKSRILQSLFDGADLVAWREEFKLPKSKFTKVIMALYYAPNKDELIAKCSSVTKQNFTSLLTQIWGAN